MTDRTESGLHTPQHDSRQEPQPYINPPQDEDSDSNEFLDQLAGANTEGTAYVDQSDIDPLEQVTMTDVYQGDTDANQELGEGDVVEGREGLRVGLDVFDERPEICDGV